ncbi:condensation domain-containing protein [Streptomyces sp. Pv4-95]|uniref:condensation domain-containing protein n=1 Tax=Streptomyces sp. Pv4-95 TaxID=3049543 RepID=UPI0038917142
MASSRSTEASMTVVAVGPVLELHGALDPAALERALECVVARHRGLRTWCISADGAVDLQEDGVLHAHLERHGSAHHTVRLVGRPNGPSGQPMRDLHAGMLADLLTSSAASVELSPGQRDVLRSAPGGAARAHHSVLLRLAGPVEEEVLRRALRAVMAAHPMLSARIPLTPEGRMPLTTDMDGGTGRYDPLRTVELTGRAPFEQAVAATRRGLAPHTGVLLRALLVRDRGKKVSAHDDLLFLAVHDLGADMTSWRILLEDLDAALDALAAGTPPRLESDAGRFEEWAERQRALTAEPEAVTRGRDAPDGGSAASLLATPGAKRPQARRTDFVLSAGETTALTEVLPARYGLSVVELLAGAFGQALARTSETHDVVFDIRTDGREGLPGHARALGPYTRVRSVRFDSDRHVAPDRYLAAVVPAFTDDGGPSGCLRADPPLPGEAPPASACFTHHLPAQLLPHCTHFTPADNGAPKLRPEPADSASVYEIEVSSHVEDGRLHVRTEWYPHSGARADEIRVDVLIGHLRPLLMELARSGKAGGSVPPVGPTVAATPRQRELLSQSLAHPGAGHHVEQLHWTWHGPLDRERFTAAWQSVFDNEALLRAAWDRTHSRVVLHGRATVQVVRLSHNDVSWARLLERDRSRGVDPHRPGALRITLFEDDPGDGGAVGMTRVLLTYHHALLDSWSIQLLLFAFYRAYLHDGYLGGGERRPDLRDYTRWLSGQDLSPARRFWSERAWEPGMALHPARAGAPTGLTGFGRLSRRLPRPEAVRLVHWAASWGVTEATALQAAWALLLHRATGDRGPTTVGFGVSVAGRAIALQGVEHLPGPLRGILPMTVRVDPTAGLPQLLDALRDRTIDISAYEWVSTEHIRQWSGCPTTDGLFGTALVFESHRRPPEYLVAELAAHGIRVEPPRSTGAGSTLPIRLTASFDPLGALVVTAVYDRVRFDDEQAAKILAQSMQLLREFMDVADSARPIASVLEALHGAEVPRMAEGTAGRDLGVFTELREGEGPDAGTVCLVPPAGATYACYSTLVPSHTGPERLLALRSATEAPDAAAEALRTLLPPDRRLLLAGWSGSGHPAHEIARRVTGADAPGPLVVTYGGGPADADGLARTLMRLTREPEKGTGPDGGGGHQAGHGPEIGAHR